MQLLADYFPLIVFFIAYKWAGIYAATAVAIVASVAQIAWFRWKGKVSAVHWLSLAIIGVFGGATLVLQDETFIKWKPTVLYWAFAAVLLGAEWLFQRNLIRSMMAQQITLPDAVWARLNLSWGAFFLLMGALNLYVAYHFSESDWVNFKLFGGTGLMLLFVLAQGLVLARYAQDEQGK